MDSLPLELKIQLGLDLSLDELSKLCQTNISFSLICQDDSFWAERTKLDFPDSLLYHPQGVSWKAYYYSMARPRTIPVYYHGDLLDPELPFSDYNPMFSSPEIKRGEIAIFYDRDFNPIATLNERRKFALIHDRLSDVTGILVADRRLPLTQEAIYAQRLSPESPFPFYGFERDDGLVLFTTKLNPGGDMSVRQSYCKDDPIFGVIIIATFNAMVQAGLLTLEPEPIPSTNTLSKAEVAQRLRNVGLPKERIFPWITFPTSVICRSVRNILRRMGHMLN